MRLSQSLYHFQCIFCLFVVYRGLLQLSRANCSPHLRIFVLLLYHDRSLTPRWRNSRSLVLLEPNKNPSIHFSRFQPTYATKFTCTQADLGRTTWSWFMTSTFSTLWPINKQLSDGGIQRRFHGQKEKKNLACLFSPIQTPIPGSHGRVRLSEGSFKNVSCHVMLSSISVMSVHQIGPQKATSGI